METITPHPYLNHNEYKAVLMLADDKSYDAIKRDFNLSALSLCGFMAGIRRKTGIGDTKNALRVQQYLRDFTQSANGPGPTPDQKDIIQRVLGMGRNHDTLQAIAYIKKKSVEEIRELYQNGLTAMGIFAKDERERRVQARTYLANQTVVIGGMDRLTDKHLAVLRMYADGMKDKAIIAELITLGIPASYVMVESLIADGCDKLGVRARGRGVQRKLVGIALERISREKREKVTMDDPAF